MSRTQAVRVYDATDSYDYTRIQRIALILGIVGIIACVDRRCA